MLTYCFQVDKVLFVCVTEWNANPVIITVESTDYPVEKITFPTVTICREDNKADVVPFITKLFDYVRFPCYENM
jgi:hypothetical protein